MRARPGRALDRRGLSDGAAAMRGAARGDAARTCSAPTRTR
ncbi:hypothetical protein GLE_4416 [Lysobacter enzymogenes]|uniref:Uncharacterized protein n=1 Tax=Lysobacter enzymogenes TaxID=69 RepID=A0A0S2DMZ4_LYSEN|nr:hypothetical protein GLE_4416 [Lysobacter enzymogenes]